MAPKAQPCSFSLFLLSISLFSAILVRARAQSLIRGGIIELDRRWPSTENHFCLLSFPSLDFFFSIAQVRFSFRFRVFLDRERESPDLTETRSESRSENRRQRRSRRHRLPLSFLFFFPSFFLSFSADNSTLSLSFSKRLEEDKRR